jgi:hypothetical protein
MFRSSQTGIATLLFGESLQVGKDCHDPRSKYLQSSMPMPTWSELQSQLQALRDDVPRMLRDNPDSTDFFGMFAGMGWCILENAPPDLTDSVYSELGAILRDLKLADDPED